MELAQENLDHTTWVIHVSLGRLLVPMLLQAKAMTHPLPNERGKIGV